MDDLKKTWERLKADSDQFKQWTAAEIQASIHQNSKGLLEKLTKRVLIKLLLCILGTLIFTVAIPFTTPFVSQILLFILMIGYLIGSVLLFQEYQQLKNELTIDGNLLSRLRSFRTRIKDVIRYEELIGLIFYPVSAAGGYFIGLKVAAPEKPILDQPIDWIIFIVLLLVITPLSHLATQWLNKQSFGKILQELDQNIKDLETQEG